MGLEIIKGKGDPRITAHQRNGSWQAPEPLSPEKNPFPPCLSQAFGLFGTLSFCPVGVERPGGLGEGGAWCRGWKMVTSLRA